MDNGLAVGKREINEHSFEALFIRLENAIVINIELQSNIRNMVDRFNGPKSNDITDKESTKNDSSILSILHSFARKLEINNGMLQCISNDLNEIL